MKEKYRYKKRALFQITKVLWHLDIFRRSFRELSGHACMQESCIFCALKELFAQLQFSQESALPPDALRRALAESFFDQQRFQLGFMDDAAECFENILLRIHYHIASHEAEDMCSAQHCIPHQKFAMTLVEQSVCGKCGATSEPLPFTQMVHYVSASALIAQATSFTPYHSDMFSQLLNKAGAMGDIRDCPSACGAKIQICRTLMNKPEIVSVGIVWDSEQPTLAHIMSVFATVGTSLRLSDLFHSVVDSRWAVHTEHALVGVVTYYGKHYSTFFFHTKLRMWIYFDDATVREVGPRWDQVVDKCRRGRYQPLLLLYAAPGGTPINADTAPKTTAAADMWMGQRTMTNSRRSMTPDPDRPIGDYQNLTDMQAVIFGQQRQQRSNDCVDGVVLNHPRFNNEPLDPLTKNNMENSNDFYRNGPDGQGVPRLVRRDSGSSGNSSSTDRHLRRVDSNSSSGCPTEGGLNQVLDRLNLPRRRDSGNWSGDRNSASSSSSTSTDNPYLYILSKAKSQNGPRSPTSIKPGEVSSSSSGPCDAGYDSYSLSSTDSLTLQTGLKHNLQLAQIPEGYGSAFPQPPSGDDCEKLCREADQLLEKSVATEEAKDLTTALVLCQAAVSKARKAMDAPYHNDKTYCIARLKHTTCVMRMRSLHRRLVSEKQAQDGVSNAGSGNHSRQNSRDKGSNGSHSRQNSKDGSQGGPVHSRQNSREGLAGSGRHGRHNSRENLLSAASAQAASQTAAVQNTGSADKPTSKTIQIYGTLPKSKKSPTVVTRTNSGSGSSSSGSPATKSRFEDEEYILYDRPGRESRFSSRNKKAEEKVREKRTRSEERANVSTKNPPETKETKDKKKQHKIRRKLLMGGLIRRKNRSMPDLREDENNGAGQTATLPAKVTLDESALSLNGYLSEGHLEYSGNPNLERSKLMRKSFHGSAGKVLHAAKVPPPPPLRTTSQLSATSKRPQLPLPQEKDEFHPAFRPDSSSTITSAYRYESAQYANGGVLLNQQQDWRPQSPEQASELLVTKAQIHCDAGDVVGQSLDLPPYPSPAASACHSRQASDEFPPPPSPSDLSRLTSNGLISQIGEKRQQIQPVPQRRESEPAIEPAGDNWLRELQTRLKDVNMSNYDDPVKTSVRDLASQFEGRAPDNRAIVPEMRMQPPPIEPRPLTTPTDLRPHLPPPEPRSQTSTPEIRPTDPRVQPAEGRVQPFEEHEPKPEESPGPGILTKSKSSTSLKSLGLEGKKKKNVTFCDQVVLVATADDEETDDYIPNPILERVLRGAFHSKKDSSYSAPLQREIRSLKDEAPIADSVQTKLDMQRAEQKQMALNQESQNMQPRTTNMPVPVRLPVQRAIPHKVYQPPPHMYHQSRPPYNPPPQYQNSPPNSYQTNSQPSYQSPSQPAYQTAQTPFQNGPQPSYQPTSQSTYQPPSQPSYQSNSQPSYQPSSQSSYLPIPQPPYQPNPQPSYPSNSQPAYQTSSQPSYQPNSQQPYQPNSQPSYQSNSQPSYQTNSQPSYQTNAQPPYQSVPQTPYQPASQPAYQSVPQTPYQPVPQSQYQSVPQSPYQPVPQTSTNSYQPPPSPSYPSNPQNPYQPVPQKQTTPGPYQTVPQLNMPQNRAPYYHPQSSSDLVNGPPAYHPPPPALGQGTYSYQRINSSSPVPNGPSTPGPFQHPPPPRQPMPPTNGTSNAVSHPCNLCRKKVVSSPSIYCTDCDFYMSRFKPKE